MEDHLETSRTFRTFRVNARLSLVGGNALGNRQMKPFHEVQASNLGSCSVKDEIDSRGYLLIRGLLPQHTLNQVLGDITRILYSAGWLVRDDDPLERMADISSACGDPDPTFRRIYEAVFNLESFQALPHDPVLKQVMRELVGEKILIHPKPICRLIFPRCERLLNYAHQDFRFIDGDPECFTAWIPLHDCPSRMGPLQILEGSHRFGIKRQDCENIEVRKIPEGAVLFIDWDGATSARGMC